MSQGKSPLLRHRAQRLVLFGLLVSLGAGLAALAWSLVAGAPGAGGVESFVDESVLPQLPPPSESPPAELPGFKRSHPRLPAPTLPEYDLLLQAHRPFLEEQRRRAAGGSGDLQAAILMARVEPGSQNLALLRDRLIGLKFEWRGADQTKPLALAYDWLYEQWSPADRQALLRKALDGCDYEIALIREQRLSPYNVILYNAPLQALMACALATFQDDPRSVAVMNFTADLWKNRVLPVWRQVMGRNGGWHEGGEYVGIGIGQAIYELPAMWRSATGEDLFASEPGIRGFLDFLVYRKRPDGTDFRWGDAAAFDKIVPDAFPLALEFRHAPAYSLWPPAADDSPSGWPWGPLTDSSL